AILPDVLLLVCRTPAGRSNLRRGACGRGVPLDGGHRGPSQPSREQVVPAIAEHVEKRVVGVDDRPVGIRNHHADDVRLDQPPDPRLPFLQLTIQAAVVQRHRRLRCEHLQDGNPAGRKDVGSEIVFEIEQGNQRGLFHERHAEYRASVLRADGLIGGKWIRRRGIAENDALVGTRSIADDRLGKFSRGDGRLAQNYRHGTAAGARFRLDQQLRTARQNEQPTFGARVLDRGAQERLDELVQHDFARDGLRDLEYGREIEVFDRRPDRATRNSGGLYHSQVRVELIEL